MKLASLRAALKGLAENVAKRKGGDAAGNIGHFEHWPARAGGGDFDFDLLVVEFAGAVFPAKAFPRRRLGGGTDQRVEHAILGRELRARLDALAAAFLDEADRHLDEIAHDLLDVAADIADLGEFRGLDLQEGRVGEPRQPARDLGLAAAGGADHQYVLWQNLLAHLTFETEPAPTVAQRDGDGALGRRLSDDVAVEFGNNLARREIGHISVPSEGDGDQIVSTTIL